MTDQHQLVKRFIAPNMTRALELVQKELGPEAVILSSKRVDKGIEIVTSLEPDLPTRGIDVRREFGQNFDAELDTVLPSDSAWRSQAGIEQAAASYGGKVEQNGMHQEVKPAKKTGKELAAEIERARERMLAAKRTARQADEDGLAENPERYAQDGLMDQSRQYHGSREQSQSYQSQGHQSSPSNHNSGFNQRDPRDRYTPEDEYQRDNIVPLQSGEFAPSNYENYSHREGVQGGTENRGQQSSPRNTQQESVTSSADQQRLDALQSELADMRMLLEQQVWRMTDGAPNTRSAGIQKQFNMPRQYSLVNEHLERLGLSDAVMEQLGGDIGPVERASDAWRKCMAKLAKQIPVAKDDILKKGGVYAFVGQTGVGKTTTIAKLAAQFVMKHGAGKVALVTTDSYRVGAYEQLRSMGRILNVPVKAVDAQNSLVTVLASLKQFPLILIDTAGFRHGDPLLKAQLKSLDACPFVKRILVMSCNNQVQTMKASVHAYASNRNLDGCVLTKIDESATIGEAISVVVEKRLPITYLTDGQEIPKDIERASGHGLVAKAVGMLKQSAAGGVVSASF